MRQDKTMMIVLVTLVIGFAGGFVLRPVIAPTQQTAPVPIPSPIVAVPSEARGTQYFVAHINEALPPHDLLTGLVDGVLRAAL